MKPGKHGMGWILILFFFILLSCGGGGGGGSDPSEPDNDTGDIGDNGSSSPVITGFDFPLQEGDFWEYAWDYKSSYVASGSSSSSSYAGTFRVTLGAPVSKDGITFYEMLISGTTDAGDRRDMKPKGAYLAVSQNKIMILDSNATTIKTLFDAQTGLWPGSGFFGGFPGDTLFSASLGRITNDYIDEPAYRVSESSSASQCEYFPGVGTICGGDYNENLDEREYYAENVGPVGYYAYFSMSDPSSSDGGWWASNTTHIGLTASSLRGDTLNYTLEIEPNNQTAAATPIALPATVQGDDVSETYLGGTTPVSMGMTHVTEIEPNNSPFSPQAVNIPSSITAHALDGDANTSVEVSPSPTDPTYVATFEDWYEVIIGASKTLDVTLDFPETGADLDMYLFSLENDNSTIIHASSTADNVGLGTHHEEMNKYLLSGTYYVAVDAYDTPNNLGGYTLGISTGDNFVAICDWYRFSIASQTQVDVAVTGGPRFVLMEAAGVDTLASGAAAGASILLSPGTYLIGVSDGGPYTLVVDEP